MTWKALFAVVGGFLLHLTLGTLYTFGNMNPYITSYLHHYNGLDNMSATIWIFASTILFQGIFMWLGGVLESKFGTKLTVLLGGWIMSLGVFLTFFTIKHGLFLTILTYGMMFGAGIGLSYSVAIAAAMSWYPEKRGLIGGIVVAGFGGGAFVFDFVQTEFINPQNLKMTSMNNNNNQTTAKYFNEKEILNRIPSCFLLLGGLYATIQLIAALCISKASKTSDEELSIMTGIHGSNLDLLHNHENEKKENEMLHIESDFTPMQMIRTTRFWFVWTTFLCNSVCIVIISTLYKTFGATFITNDHFLAIVGSLAALFNSFGRIGWGVWHDLAAYRWVMSGLTLSMAFLLVTFTHTQQIGQYAYLVWVCLLFFTFSGNFAILPAFCAQKFGGKYMATNYGILFTANALAGVLTGIIVHFINLNSSWFTVFIIGSAFSMIGLLITMINPN